LLIADISGYTRFLQSVAEAHQALIVDAPEPPPAYAVMSGLLDAIVRAIAPTFRLAKFEGDAVFAVADDEMLDGQALLDTLHRSYAAFRSRLTAAGSEWTCTCDSCITITNLDLKFIAHHGTYVAQPIAGHEELLGPDVNIAHRLLKNHARELIGGVPYALITDAATQALGLSTESMLEADEAYDGGPPFRVHLLVLQSAPDASADPVENRLPAPFKG
jgi:predicted enzyme involved in methoxymalonyl-ACP biosynthesis